MPEGPASGAAEDLWREQAALLMVAAEPLDPWLEGAPARARWPAEGDPEVVGLGPAGAQKGEVRSEGEPCRRSVFSSAGGVTSSEVGAEVMPEREEAEFLYDGGRNRTQSQVLAQFPVRVFMPQTLNIYFLKFWVIVCTKFYQLEIFVYRKKFF